jgi:uncharacterized protein (TIGR00251 family)
MNLLDYIKDNRLKIIVKPNSPKNEIIGYDNGLRVNIKAPAENNKANIEVIKFFRKITKRDVNIISGLKSKKKVLKFID